MRKLRLLQLLKLLPSQKLRLLLWPKLLVKLKQLHRLLLKLPLRQQKLLDLRFWIN